MSIDRNYENSTVSSLIENLKTLDAITQGEVKIIVAVAEKGIEQATMADIKAIDRIAVRYLGPRIRDSKETKKVSENGDVKIEKSVQNDNR